MEKKTKMEITKERYDGAIRAVISYLNSEKEELSVGKVIKLARQEGVSLYHLNKINWSVFGLETVIKRGNGKKYRKVLREITPDFEFNKKT